MEELALEKLKYPIGRIEISENYSPDFITEKIAEVASFPQRLKTVV